VSLRRSAARAAILIAATVALAGCATVRDTVREARGGPGQKLDPWEKWNRRVFSFNEKLDENVLKPVATAYSNVVPQPVRSGVDNFVANVADAWSAINNILQGKVAAGMSDMMRVGTNTVFGVFGVMDVASEAGLERHREDFGQTLGRWGVGAGAYIVWPLLGPSTVRESFALPLDTSATPALLFQDGSSKYGIFTLQLINARANLLGASRVLDDIALDKYTFVRDAYLQRRRSLVYDGDAPDEPSGEPPDTPADAASAPAK
jgi:phospholipid-binding lipoprotein MlaA